jgi:hypothetical protein
LYPATPTLSIEAFHERSIRLEEVAVAVSVGMLAAVVSSEKVVAQAVLL